MNYFDLHCDTLYEMYERGVGFEHNGLCVDLTNAKMFGRYARVAAIWTKSGIPDDDAYERYKNILSYAKKKLPKGAVFCTSSCDVARALEDKKIPLMLAVEGANLLGGDISRLDSLYLDGVRFLTLTWKGESCIGGAWDEDAGLCDFGRLVIKKCAELGIVVDVSHASRKSTAQTLEIADLCGAKVIATHSNSYACCAHGRNLTDDEARAISNRRGIIGISMTPGHLSDDGSADVSDIVRHVQHYLSLGLCDNICIGADFDGVVNLPRGISDERDMIKIDSALKAAGVDEKTREKIFWQNAANFISSNM